MTSPSPTVLVETSAWIAVDKPAGILVERHSEFASVEAWVANYLTTRNRKPFVGIVHRLDRPVGGVLLLAKKKSVLKLLNEQFARKRVQKFYRATVGNMPEPAEGKLLHFLKKDNRLRRAVVTTAAGGGVRSELRYRLLEATDRGYELEILPLSGRYHQIRAQLSAIGCPIVGDEKYGGPAWSQPDAIALRAQRIIFTDPVSGKRVSVSES